MNLTAKQFDQGNALACAMISSLAYPINRRAELEDKGGEIISIDDAGTDTHVVIMEEVDCIVIGFAGTNPRSIRNWITDARFFRTCIDQKDNGDMVRVHEGFWKALNAVAESVLAALRKIVVGSRPIFVTGHSLGGGLAILFAPMLARQWFNVFQVYTFGQPRVGNSAWKRHYESIIAQTYRVVYEEDIVARVPHLPSLHDPYRHCGQEIFFPSIPWSSGKMPADFWIDPPVLKLIASDVWGIYRAWCVSKFAGAIDPVADHFLDNYIEALEAANKRGGNN